MIKNKASLINGKILPIILLIALLGSLFAYASIESGNDTSMIYKVDSGTRRTSLNETNVQMNYQTKTSTQPQVITESGARIDLTPTQLPARFIESQHLFDFKNLTTEIVYSALSLVLENSYGKVDFDQVLDLSKKEVFDLDSSINISSNHIEIDGIMLPEFNKSSRITIKGLNFNNIRILKDGTDCLACNVLSFDGSSAVFDAPGFTIYSAANGSVLPGIRISTRVNITNASMNVSGDLYNNSYPSNVTIAFGFDAGVQFNYTNELNTTLNFTNFTQRLQTVLDNGCSCSGCSLGNFNLTCTIALNITSEAQGIVLLSYLNISQEIRNASFSAGINYTLIDLDDYFYDRDGDVLSYGFSQINNVTVTIIDGIVNLSSTYHFSSGDTQINRTVVFNATDGTNSTLSSNVTIWINGTAEEPTQSCGNNVREGSEVCDGSDNSCSGGQSCKSDCSGCEGGGEGEAEAESEAEAEAEAEAESEAEAEAEAEAESEAEGESETEIPGTGRRGYINCVNITRKTSATPIEFIEGKLGILDWFKIPFGYEAAIPPFNIDCSGDSLAITVSVPEDYTDLQLLKCEAGKCTPREIKEVKELWCERELVNTTYVGSEILQAESFKIEIEQSNLTIGKIRKTLESGDTKVRFMGEGLENITASLKAADESVEQPKNPSFRIIGTPTILRISETQRNISTALTLPYYPSDETDETTAAIYGRKANSWIYIGGIANRKADTITATIENLKEYTDKDGEAEFAVIANICIDCLKAKLVKVYDPITSKGTIVLVHGLGSSPATFNQIIDDIIASDQQFQVWTYGYPSSRSIEENAQDLADLLEANSGQFDNLFIIAHSLGGLITEKATYNSYNQSKEGIRHYGYISKLRKMILVGVPNEGTPGAEFYKNLFKNIINEETKAKFFVDPESPVIEELTYGMITPQIPGVDYFVLAGTKPFEFNLVLFTLSTEKLFRPNVKNDGFVTVISAQHIGDEYINNLCTNYWEVDLSHLELIDDPLAVKILEKIISREIIQDQGDALGGQQFFEFNIEQCSPRDQYIIIGKKLRPEMVYDPTGCSCGNGYCGAGEDAINCPVDCANKLSRENICRISLIPLMLLILIVLAVYSYYVYKKYYKKEYMSKRWTLFVVMLSLLAIILAFQYLLVCKTFGLYIFLIILFLVLYFSIMPMLRKSTDTKPNENLSKLQEKLKIEKAKIELERKRKIIELMSNKDLSLEEINRIIKEEDKKLRKLEKEIEEIEKEIEKNGGKEDSKQKYQGKTKEVNKEIKKDDTSIDKLGFTIKKQDEKLVILIDQLKELEKYEADKDDQNIRIKEDYEEPSQREPDAKYKESERAQNKFNETAGKNESLKRLLSNLTNVNDKLDDLDIQLLGVETNIEESGIGLGKIDDELLNKKINDIKRNEKLSQRKHLLSVFSKNVRNLIIKAKEQAIRQNIKLKKLADLDQQSKKIKDASSEIHTKDRYLADLETNLSGTDENIKEADKTLENINKRIKESMRIALELKESAENDNYQKNAEEEAAVEKPDDIEFSEYEQINVKEDETEEKADEKSEKKPYKIKQSHIISKISESSKKIFDWINDAKEKRRKINLILHKKDLMLDNSNKRIAKAGLDVTQNDHRLDIVEKNINHSDDNIEKSKNAIDLLSSRIAELKNEPNEEMEKEKVLKKLDDQELQNIIESKEKSALKLAEILEKADIKSKDDKIRDTKDEIDIANKVTNKYGLELSEREKEIRINSYLINKINNRLNEEFRKSSRRKADLFTLFYNNLILLIKKAKLKIIKHKQTIDRIKKLRRVLENIDSRIKDKEFDVNIGDQQLWKLKQSILNNDKESRTAGEKLKEINHSLIYSKENQLDSRDASHYAQKTTKNQIINLKIQIDEHSDMTADKEINFIIEDDKLNEIGRHLHGAEKGIKEIEETIERLNIDIKNLLDLSRQIANKQIAETNKIQSKRQDKKYAKKSPDNKFLENIKSDNLRLESKRRDGINNIQQDENREKLRKINNEIDKLDDVSRKAVKQPYVPDTAELSLRSVFIEKKLSDNNKMIENINKLLMHKIKFEIKTEKPKNIKKTRSKKKNTGKSKNHKKNVGRMNRFKKASKTNRR